ncbi:hypothetical protein [Natrialba sp. INN-245]|uniref:hypothetical protein n=1 Tax=Natrialba sp. INN-245 TaxID=2690967 RepID=UPI00130F73EC|nr:hypothetical protein [Natrialba sp. INN-245]MWV40270.1 hypothetical protein [Natrialba sp. INN-245]
MRPPRRERLALAAAAVRRSPLFGATVGGLALPAAATAYFVATGYGLEGIVPPGALGALLVALGALLGGAAIMGYPATVGLSLVALVVLGPLWFVPVDLPPSDPSAEAATGPVLSVTILAIYLFAGEYAVRNRRSVIASLTPRTVAVGLTAGAVHTLASLWASASVRQEPVLEGVVPTHPLEAVALVYVGAGLVLLGAAPAVALYRLRLVTPTVALVASFSWTYRTAWDSLAVHRETGGAAASISPEADTLYTLLWMVPLAVVLAVGFLEYALRSIVLDRRRLTSREG